MVKYIALYTLAFLTFYAFGVVGVYFAFNDNLPDIDAWKFQPKRITKVYSQDGQHLKDFREENREILTYEEIPRSMQDALISIEDQRFFSHWGIDIRRIFGAIFANIRSMSLTAQGASTITQQLARNLFKEVGNQRSSATIEAVVASYSRKVREQITAVYIERLYTKQEILTMYLNKVYFGHGAHGLKSAARYYFDKDVSALAVEESAMLAGLLKAPNGYSPIRRPARAIKRRNQVLRSMVDNGKLSRTTYERLRRNPVRTHLRSRAETYGLAPYFVEHVRQQLQREFGTAIYREGFSVRTTLDSRLQRIAEKHFAIEIGKVQEKVNSYLTRQDSAAGLPDSAIVQAAFVVMDPQSGRVLVMIGGRDFNESKFNRATQAKRQPGSAFKPFVYTAAIDNSRFTIDIFDDNAITLRDPTTGDLWDPENYDKKFKGPMTLREGFKSSRNIIALKLADEIGPPLIRRYARNMGISTPIRAIPSIGIGTSEVRLLDMVAAYCIFPNKGIYTQPFVIDRIKDKDGNEFYSKESGQKREALRPAVAVIMTDMMRSVVDEVGGTGRAIRTRFHFRSAAAGKTGTTNDYTDAWFIGFTPHLVAGVWVGMDDPSLRLWPRQAGSVAALPLWANFMKEVYNEITPYRNLVADSFDYPENLVKHLPICNDTHKLATRFCPNQGEDLFIIDEAQPASCPLHGGSQTPAPSRLQRF